MIGHLRSSFDCVYTKIIKIMPFFQPLEWLYPLIIMYNNLVYIITYMCLYMLIYTLRNKIIATKFFIEIFPFFKCA